MLVSFCTNKTNIFVHYFCYKVFLDLFSFYLKTLEDKKGVKFLYSLRDNITFFIFFQFFILTSLILLNFNKQILRLILSFTA